MDSVHELADNQEIEKETIEKIAKLLSEQADILGFHNLRYLLF
jgi:hypothetical protein